MSAHRATSVNLVAFFILVHPFSAADTLAFVLAAVIASTNNFFWNRHWTFPATEDHPVRQAVRFFLVSAVVLLLSLGIYKLLVDAGISPAHPGRRASPGSSRPRFPSSFRSSGASRPDLLFRARRPMRLAVASAALCAALCLAFASAFPSAALAAGNPPGPAGAAVGAAGHARRWCRR